MRGPENHSRVIPRRGAVRPSEAAPRPGEVGFSVICYPEDRWEPWQTPDVHLTNGPDRIYDDDPKPNGTRRVGFGVMPEPREPLLWEGDDS